MSVPPRKNSEMSVDFKAVRRLLFLSLFPNSEAGQFANKVLQPMPGVAGFCNLRPGSSVIGRYVPAARAILCHPSILQSLV